MISGNWRSQAMIHALVLVCAAAVLVGCQDTNRVPLTEQVGTSASRAELNEQHLLTAFSVLHDTDDVQRPEALSTVVVRLNQWVKQQKAVDDWQLDPLVEQLPENLRQMPIVRGLSELDFPGSDGFELQQTVWLNAISERARGEEGQPLAIAQNLFDWVIRNIQIDRDAAADVPHLVRDGLILGHGTAVERAWIFALLGRQQGLDIVMLALPGEKDASDSRFWLPALYADGELFLFDTRLGCPIPGPEGKPVATLRDLLADGSLLRRLDVDSERVYPVKAEDLERIVVQLEASPLYLSRRMRLVEADLPGKEPLVLSARPTLLAEKLKSHPHVATVELWKLPYERILAVSRPSPDQQKKAMAEYAVLYEPTPILWQARTLHLLGEFDGDKGANALYQRARPSDADLKSYRDRAPEKDRPRVEAELAKIRLAKQTSSYWLGVIALERGNYPAAIDYLKVRCLEAAPDSPWTAGARYNLGRALEASGQTDQAISFYEADLSAQRPGNLLRARRLQQASKSAPPAAD